MVRSSRKFRRLVLLSFGLLGLAASAPACAQDVLRVLAWDGYADPEIVAAFEKQAGVKVEVTYVNSDDDMWGKLSRNDGRDYDVFAVNTAELQRYIDRGLSVPVEVEHIGNRLRQLPRFRDYAAIPGLIRAGHTYAVPYTWAETGLIYNRRLVKTPPRSIAAMWAPEYRGRVLMFNTSNHSFTLAGQLMGVKNPFRMSEAELRRAARRLVKLRRNVLAFYGTAEDAAELFRRHDVALVFANYGMQQVKALRDQGADIGYVIPQEGALAWLDCWAVSRGAGSRALAESWINYMLEKSVGEHLTAAHGLANTIVPSGNSLPGDKIIWLEPLEDPARRNALWERVLSGDGMERF